MLLIRNIRLKPNDSEDIIKEKIIKRLHTKTTNFHYTIYKKSIDSRKETEYVSKKPIGRALEEVAKGKIILKSDLIEKRYGVKYDPL